MIHFYTLLYINPEDSVLGNNVSGDYSEKIRKYVCCCSLLSKSLESYKLPSLKIITNDSAKIHSIDPSLDCRKIEFKTEIDSDIAFSSAHRKLDVLKYFSTLGDGEYSILLDSDMVCISEIPSLLQKIARAKLPLYYDISAQQIPAFTAERICKDKELLIRKAFGESDFSSTSFWAGGEFIAGSAEFFRLLSGACFKILPHYIQNAKRLFHNGDEMIVSSALEYLIQKKKVSCFDGGTMLFAGRYYDSGTNHIQNVWRYFKQCFLVHLPMDKNFLADYAYNLKQFEPAAFMKALEKHLYSNNTFLNATVRADKLLQKLTSLYYRTRALAKKLTGHGNAPVEY